MRRCLILVLVLYSAFGCSTRNEEVKDKVVYEGPVNSFNNVVAHQSDSARVLFRLTAARHEIFGNGDEIFPKGIFLELFDKTTQQISTTISANEAFRYLNKQQIKLVGKVVIKGLESGDELNTELLFLEEKNGKIHTNSFVTIKSDGEVHTGEGLTSNADFSRYRILKPAGTIPIDEQF